MLLLLSRILTTRITIAVRNITTSSSVTAVTTMIIVVVLFTAATGNFPSGVIDGKLKVLLTVVKRIAWQIAQN